MQTGIYCYTNKSNGKKYIGQAVDISRRAREHKNRSANSNSDEYQSLLHRAFRKYGYDNFLFEILEECFEEQLDQRERYWISYYNSIAPYGYNLNEGGEGARHFCTHNKHQLELLYNLLKNTKMKYTDIAAEVGVSIGYVGDFNNGKLWYNENIDYPIRKKDKAANYCIDCGCVISKGSIRCTQCHAMATRTTERPQKEQLLQEVATSGFKQVGQKYGVSDNTIRKWCISYGLPSTKREIVALYNKTSN